MLLLAVSGWQRATEASSHFKVSIKAALGYGNTACVAALEAAGEETLRTRVP